MTRTADISSDRDLAGLMLRCNGTSPDVILIVITPLPPRAQPGVTIGANGREWHFEAQVVPPGAELLLPAASDLATGPWQSAHQLSVQISWQDNSIRGTIPIDGLGSALGTLAANCPPEEAPSNGGRPR